MNTENLKNEKLIWKEPKRKSETLKEIERFFEERTHEKLGIKQVCFMPFEWEDFKKELETKE